MSGELQIQKSSWGLNGSVDMCFVYLFLPFLCQIEGVPASFPFTALWDCWWRTMQGWVCETKWGCWRVSQSIPISLSWTHFKSKPGLYPISCCLRGHPKQKNLNSPTSSLYQGDLPHPMLLYNSCFRRQLEQPIGLLTSQLEYFNNMPIVSHPPTHKK